MFYAKADNNNASEPVSFTIRVRGLGSSATQSAAQGISSAAQAAAAGVNKGVYMTRGWAAPRLESAADYWTATAAPMVSSALRTTAAQVRPEDVTQKRSRSMLTWSVLAAAIAATAGAVATLVRYRYRASMTVDADEEFGSDAPASAQPGTAGSQAAEGSATASAGTADSATTDAEVNGRVSSSGW